MALRWIGMLGVYSYSLYIWHIAAARLAERAAGIAAPGLLDQPLLVLLLTYVGAIAVAIVMTRLVEWPMLRVRNRVFPSKTHAVPKPERPEARTLP
jgi:peptidoglycan/LPS O-acetylase OafA/YrhL